NQEAAKVALESPLSKTAVGEMVQTFEQRRNEIWEALNKVEGISCRKPGGAFYLFPNISEVCSNLGLMEFNEGLPEAEKKETSPAGFFQMFALYEHQVAVLDRRSFGSLGSEGKHYLRLSTASEIGVLREGVRRLEEASKNLAGLQRFLQNRPDLQ
ncbi:MAG: aminotransferase class I/II-fold pyridoxal phosphate-dependent enzyme, partial [SAR324 cluster bacterium]|nr:aminotransferase class I/II-fold pyridoxal phosphate-dependent enzyme [SAR324 cluster bacterium]